MVCNKTREIGTSNRVENPPPEITGLDIQEPILINYNNTENTKFPNDELERVNGEPYKNVTAYSYGKEPPREPYLSEYYPEQQLNIWQNLKIPQMNFKDENYTATGSKINSEPSMHGEEGHLGTYPKVRGYEGFKNNDKIYDLPPQYSEALNPTGYGKYTRTQHEHDDICAKFEGKIYDLSSNQRPVPPSEGKGYTNTHPNCLCYYTPVEKPKRLNVLTKLEKKHVHSIHKKIGHRAKNHTLHTVFEDGHMSQKTRGTNPMKEIRETLQELHTQFNWFTDDYLYKVADLGKRVGGKFILVRASAETITDHRSEGEPYRRLLKGEELMQLTRTGIGKTTDINHLGKEFEVDSTILDAEYDPIRKESQMLVHLRDMEIIHYIETGQISEVSINAGAPRRMDTQCDTGECFVVPTGLILGELDGIAFTWVVSDRAGIVWHGKYIPKATAGVSTTKIEII